MTRRRLLFLRGAGAGLLMTALAIGVAAQPAPPPQETGPYRLVPLAPDGIGAALAQVDQGTLVRLPAADFERLARPSAVKADPGAALLATRYRGRVSFDGGEPNLVGTGEWVVRSPAPGAALWLPAALTPIRQARWPDGRDAVLFKPPRDDRLRLHMPAAGDLSLNLDWSARGVAEPGEVRFDLRLPPSPVAHLDLELPAGYVPVVPADEALLTGPFPAERGSSWRLAVTGSDRLGLVLRRVDEARPRLFAKLHAAHRLTGGEGSAWYEFQVDSAKVGFSDLEFTVDAAITPTGVRVNNLAGWSVEPGTGPTRRLVVRLSEPTRSAKVEVTGTFAVPFGPVPWVSPVVSLTDAISRGERLQIAVAAGLQFRDWRPGDYHLVKAERGLDGSYLLDVEPDPVPETRPAPVRPSVVVQRPADGLWKVDQKAEWAVGPAGEEWVIRSAVDVSAGGVWAVGFRYPGGWTLDRVEVNGSEATADAATAGRVVVDLGRQHRPGDTVEVTTRFRRARDDRSTDDGLPFPDLMPIGAAARGGRLTVRVDATLDAVPTDPGRDDTGPGSLPTGRPPGTFERRLAAEPLVGRLYVRPRATRPTADVRTELLTGANGLTARTAITVRPGGGPLTAVAYGTGLSPRVPWVWRDSQGRSAGPAVRRPAVETVSWLAGLGCRSSIGSALALSAARSAAGSCWSIQFPRPVTEPTTITAEYAVEGPDGLFDPWVIGLPFTGVVLWTDAAGRRSRRYGTGTPLRDEAVGQRPVPQYDGVRLLTVVNEDGRTEVAFRFRVRSGPATPLPVRLPPDARRIRATVSGRPVPTSAGPAVELSIPPSDGWTEVELRYTGADLGRGPFVRPGSEVPGVPFDTSAVQRVWHVSPVWRVATRGSAVPVPGTNGEVSGLPLPDWRAWVPNPGEVGLGEAGQLAVGPGATLRSALRASAGTRPVVLDAFALAAAGITADSPVASGVTANRFLTDHGMVAVDMAGAAVLTTRAEVRAWRSDPSIAPAVAEATRHGRDASGRFQSVERAGDESSVWPAPAGWAVWTTDDPIAAGPTLVRGDRLGPTAWGIAVALFLLTAALRARPRIRFVVLILWSGLAATGTVLGADAVLDVSRPLLLGAVAAGLLGCLRKPVAAPAERPSRRLEIAGGVAALVLGAGAFAADPVPVVYQLPAEADRPATVLAPPKLLAELRQARTAERVEVALTSAEYVGLRDGSGCRFHARFRVWAFEDKASRLVLPLHAVKLREVRLDGAEAGGVTAGPDGLAVSVAGRGEHLVEVRFEVAVGAAGADREVKFSAPEVPIARLKFESPRPGPRIRPGQWRGAVRTGVVGDTDHLEVDLGVTPAVQVRWPSDAAEKAAPVRARAAAVWHVGTGFARLESLTEFRVNGAGPGDVQLAVPAAADVYRVGVRTEGQAAGAPPARVRSWSVAPSDGTPFRTLTVLFQAPLEGRVVLELEMYFAARWTARPALYLPHILKVPDVESHAAFTRSGAADGPGVEAAGLVETPTEGFVKGIWAALGGGPVQPVRAYRADGAGPARLRPTVRLPAAAKGTTSELTWWVEDTRLVGRATSRVPGLPGHGLVEWRVRDGARVTDVTGPRLVAWGQTGDRVQAWFDRPVLDGTIRWAAEKALPGKRGEVTIPVPDFGGGSATTVRVRPTNGLAVSGRGPGEALPPTFPGEVGWRATGVDPARLTVWPPQSVPTPVSTTVRRSGKDSEAVTVIDLTGLGRDRPHRLTVSVGQAEGAVVTVAGPGLTAGEVASETGGRRWEVAIHAGRTTDALTVVVRRTEAKWLVPKVTVRSGPSRVADSTRTLRAESADVTLVDTAGLVRTGPAGWRAETPAWEATAARPTGRVVETGTRVTGTVRAARTGRTWTYVGRFDVPADTTGIRGIEFPPPIKVVSAEIDGTAQAFTADGMGYPEDSAQHVVGLRWTTTDPVWRSPRFRDGQGEGVPGITDWIVTVPPDLRAEGEIRTGPEPPTASVDEGVFQRGLPVRFRSAADTEPQVRLVRPAPPWGLMAVSAGLWLCFTLLLMKPARFGPERVAVLGALGGVALGAAGAALWLLPVGAVVYRAGSVLTWLRGRAKSTAESVP